MIQRGKDHSGAGGAQRSTPHMTQPNIQGQPQRGALRLAELQWAPKFLTKWPAPRRGDEAVVGLGAQCLLLAQSRHAQCADECPLLGAKRTVTNRCLPISIYEYTA